MSHGTSEGSGGQAIQWLPAASRLPSAHLLDPSSLDAARLNMVVSMGAKRALEWLSARYGVTQRVFVERLIADAEEEAMASMSRAEQKTYYAVGKQR